MNLCIISGMRTNGAVSSQGINMGLPVAQTRRNQLIQKLITLDTGSIENQHSNIFKQRNTDETCKQPQHFKEKANSFQVYLHNEMDTIEKKVANQITHNSRQQNGNEGVLNDFGIESLNSDQPSDCEDCLNSEGLNEYNVDDDDDANDDDEPIYATLSSRSCCSATTAANDDFEFFQHEDKISKLVNNNEEIEIIPVQQMAEKRFLCGSQSEEENSGQPLLYRYQREKMADTGDAIHEGCQCTDCTANQNDVINLALPLREPYQNQNMEFSYNKIETNNEKNVSHSRSITQNANEILRTVIQNELRNNRTNAFKKDPSCGTDSNSSSKSKSRDNSCSHQNGSDTKSNDVHPMCDKYLETDQITSVNRKKRDKQSMLAGSQSLNNLDELLLEEDDLIVQTSSSRKSSNVKAKNQPQNDPNSSDEREVRFLICHFYSINA